MCEPASNLPRRRRRLWGVLLTALISGAATQVAAGSPTPDPRTAEAIVEIRVEHGLLTLEAAGAPLADVLRAIGAAGGFPVLIRGELDAPVSASVAEQPLESVLRQLVGAHTLIVMHEAAAREPGAPGLAEVRVIENRDVARARDAEPPPEVAATDEIIDETPVDRASFRAARRGLAPPPTRDGILVELDEPDPAARMAAVPKIGSLRPREAIEVISYVLANDEDTIVRSRAVAALNRLDGPGARGLLRERALGDAEAGLRMQALNALASSRGERAVNVLSQALRQDPEPAVRLSAIRALGRIGGAWARSYLERATRDPDPAIADAARESLDTGLEPRDQR